MLYIISFYFSPFVRDLFPVVATNETGGRRSKSNTAGAKIKVILILETHKHSAPRPSSDTCSASVKFFSLKSSGVVGCFFLDTTLVTFVKLNPFR